MSGYDETMLKNELQQSLGENYYVSLKKDGTFVISGAFLTKGDWDRTVDVFENQDHLLKCVVAFKNAHPNENISISSSPVEKTTDGKLYAVVRTEEDMWYNRQGKRTQIASELGQLATITNLQQSVAYRNGRSLSVSISSQGKTMHQIDFVSKEIKREKDGILFGSNKRERLQDSIAMNGRTFGSFSEDLDRKRAEFDAKYQGRVGSDDERSL